MCCALADAAALTQAAKHRDRVSSGLAMHRHELFVSLGACRYRVERPWGEVPPGLGFVTDVACTADGQVLVQLRSDSQVAPESPAIIVLAPDGRGLGDWGGAGVADGHMFTPHPDGRVFVVDRDAHEVIIFSAEGERLGALGRRHYPGEPFNAPSDVAFGPDGSIYVADGYGHALVHRFSAEGWLLNSWGAPGRRAGEFSSPHAVWALPDGRVAVADRENNRVQLFTAEGHHLRDIADLHKPMDVHGSADGGFYVTDQVPRLSQYDADGQLVGRCRPVLNGAHGMWLGPDGVIYLAEMNPSRVTRLVPV
jgi:sugar lactone lactonase YvrE